MPLSRTTPTQPGFLRRLLHAGTNLLIVLLTMLGSAILPPSSSQAQTPYRDPRFGAVEAFWDTQAAVEANVAWERILFYWSHLQPYGPDDWNSMHVADEWLQWAQSQGRELVGLLKNTPLWAADADSPTEASPPRGLDLPIEDPGNLWATFVRRAVTFYGSRGVHRWIIWNEPDIAPGVYGHEWAGTVEQYYRLLKVAYLVIKEVDPTAQVHLAGLTYWHDQGWLHKFMRVATADPEAPGHGYFFDTVSLHIYFQTDTVDFIVYETRAALAAYGISKPIWINETNASPDSDPLWPIVRPRFQVDLREQASFILESYALGLSAGAQRIAVYKLMDAGLPPGGEPFGLLRPDHSRRPAYTAYRLVTQHYAGTGSARATRDPLWAQVTLDRGGLTTRVLWARTTAQVSLEVPALAAQALLIDQEGNEQTLDGQGGSYRITLPGARCADVVLGCIIGGPTYLLVEEASAGLPATPIAAAASPTAPPTEEGASPTPEVDGTPSDTPTPVSPTVTATPSVTPTPTSTPSASSTPSATATTTPSPTSSATPSPTSSATPTPSATPSLPTPTSSLTPSPEPEPEEATTGQFASLMLAGWAGMVALVGTIALVGLALWRRRSR
jgi:hypothetical protein